MITFEDIKKNEMIKIYIQQADESLKAMGYTEHSIVHVSKCAKVAKNILETLGYSKDDIRLAQIASYMHDIGNVINRNDHAQSGALMAFRILNELDMPHHDIAKIITAIGNHDEQTAFPVNSIAAAVILADKTDVRRSRVRNTDIPSYDIHDRVNYSVIESNVEFSKDLTKLYLNITLDTNICPVLDYFEIFLGRMTLCRKACIALNLEFKFNINGLSII
ncbi:MAG: HD domain-containing protein [Anaeroplasmataceae bacterium]